MNYADVIAELAPLETFDRHAFLGDEHTPQEVCDLVLALALVYNDLRDIATCRLQLQSLWEPDAEPGPRLGLQNGHYASLLRLQAGVVHELLALIKSSGAVLETISFKKALRQTSKDDKQAWRTLVDVARGGGGDNGRLAKALVQIRNKVGFHYDAKQIGRGYRSRFLEEEEGPPFLSRGNTMAKTRYYFADAAAEKYVFSTTSTDVLEFLQQQLDFLGVINQALHAIVVAFPATRGVAWEKVRAG